MQQFPRIAVGLALLAAITTASPSLGAYPDYHWSRNNTVLGLMKGASACALAVGPDGSVVIGGVIPEDYSDFSPFVKTIFIWKYASDGTLLWARQPGTVYNDDLFDVTIRDNGNVVAAGGFSGTADFGGGEMTASGGKDIFIVEYDADGNHQWSRQYGGTGDGGVRAVTTDAAGNILLAGSFYATLDLGGGNLPVLAPGVTFFLARFDATGAHLSSRSCGSATGRGAVYAMDLSPTGDLAVTGYFDRVVDFGGGSITPVNSSRDIFVVEYGADGAHRWSRGFGNTLNETGHDVAFDPAGNVLLTGYFRGPTDFGGGTFSPPATNYTTCFVASYDPAGAHRWSRVNTAVGANYGYAVTSDVDGNVLFAGSSSGMVDVGTGPLQTVGNTDAFLAKYDRNGNAVWAGVYGDGPYEYGQAVAADANHGVFMAGTFDATLRFCDDLLDAASGATFLARFGTDVATDAEAPSVPAGGVYSAGVLSWNASSDASYVTYAVYGSPNGTFDVQAVLVARTDAISLNVGNAYPYYYVKAADCVGNASAVSPRIERDPQWTAPLPPADLAYDGSTLSWSASTDPDILHYVVYGSPSSAFDDQRVRLGVTAGTTFDVSAVGYAYYHVAAVDQSLNWSGPSTVKDTVVPLRPTGVVYQPRRVSWDTPTDPGIDHFTVYGSPFGMIGQPKVTIGTTHGYTLDVSQHPYSFYWVDQTDRAGNVSPLAGVVGLDDAAPAPPGDLVLADGVLHWSAPAGIDVHYYNVYGSELDHRDAAAVLIEQPEETSLAVSSHPFRYYFVTATDYAGNESADARVYGINTAPPGPPVNLAYDTGRLSWEAPADVDLDHFTVYGSDSDTFEIGKVSLGTTYDTYFSVTGKQYPYFYVTAVDEVGNESVAARVEAPVPASYSLSVDAFPNPFRGQATIRYAVPSRGRVVLRLYDLRGALVATIVDGERDAGSYSERWRGIDAAGAPVGAGVYFARIEFAGNEKTRKVVLLK